MILRKASVGEAFCFDFARPPAHLSSSTDQFNRELFCAFHQDLLKHQNFSPWSEQVLSEHHHFFTSALFCSGTPRQPPFLHKKDKKIVYPLRRWMSDPSCYP